MSFLDLFRGKRDKSDPVVQAELAAQWVDPLISQPVEEWERRLNAYARKSAGVLMKNGVPLFRGAHAMGSRGGYRDAFWLIACDVERAHRYHRVSGGYAGYFYAESLLLSRSGVLCIADVEGAFDPITGGLVARQCQRVSLTSAVQLVHFAVMTGDGATVADGDVIQSLITGRTESQDILCLKNGTAEKRPTPMMVAILVQR